MGGRRNFGTSDTKTCSKCKENKPLSEFYPASWCKYGVRPECKRCSIRRTTGRPRYREYRSQEHVKRKQKDIRLRCSYGITVDQYEEMLRQQNGVCKICGSSNPCQRWGSFFVDHCHKTGKVRGILCYKCNCGLGSFNDNIETLENAILYLKEAKNGS